MRPRLSSAGHKFEAFFIEPKVVSYTWKLTDRVRFSRELCARRNLVLKFDRSGEHHPRDKYFIPECLSWSKIECQGEGRSHAKDESDSKPDGSF